MDRVLFTLQPHSIIDVITNSSSELFVGKSQNKEEIENLIKEVYPNYLDEYVELKSTKELSVSDVETYISYNYNGWSNSNQKCNSGVIPGFTREDMYTYDEEWKEWSFKWDFVTEENKDKVVKGIDPNDEMYFLFSKDENPDWDMQKELMEIMTRHHLG